MASHAALIGDHGVLLHVGPHKSGTSAVQTALHGAKDDLGRQGVLVPGRHRLHSRAARAATEMTRTPGMEPGTPADWDRLVSITREFAGRVAISSEYFDAADRTQADRIATDLDRERLHVVVTAVPLTSVLPSNWQQLVRVRHRQSFDNWLQQVFDRHDAGERTLFWRRQRIDWLVDLWVETVGADRVHLVIGDKARPRQLYEGFEDLLGLRRESLHAQGRGTNRSLRWPEVELLRQINTVARKQGWDDATHARFARLGASRGMLARSQFGPDAGPIRLPAWAHERATEISATMNERLGASGIHVIGDLSTLITPPTPEAELPPPVTHVDLETAVNAVMGTARAGGAGILQEKYVGPENLNDYPGISSAPTELLQSELRRRGATADLTAVGGRRLLSELRSRAARRLRRR